MIESKFIYLFIYSDASLGQNTLYYKEIIPKKSDRDKKLKMNIQNRLFFIYLSSIKILLGFIIFDNY